MQAILSNEMAQALLESKHEQKQAEKKSMIKADSKQPYQSIVDLIWLLHVHSSCFIIIILYNREAAWPRSFSNRHQYRQCWRMNITKYSHNSLSVWALVYAIKRRVSHHAWTTLATREEQLKTQSKQNNKATSAMMKLRTSSANS